MLKPVRPVTHCWCQGTSSPCAGDVEAVEEPPGFLGKEESQDSWWDREQWGHTGGTVPPHVPLGAAWTFLSQCHEKSPGTACDCQGDKTSSKDFPWEDLGSFHLIPCPGSVQCPGPGLRRVGPGVSPAPCPCFWGHSVTSAVFRNDSHPHTGCLTFLWCWNGVIGLPGGILLEPGM